MATQDNPQLLVTLNESQARNDVRGVVMLGNYVYVAYLDCNKVEVFKFDGSYEKVNDIEIEGMVEAYDLVGSTVTTQLCIPGEHGEVFKMPAAFIGTDMKPQLFISCEHHVIRRVNLKTEVSDVFMTRDIDPEADMCIDIDNLWLSLVDCRLLFLSRDSLLMYDIDTGERIKKVPLAGDWKTRLVRHAIESNRDSFFVSQEQMNGSYTGSYTVSEIDSEGRVIRVLNDDKHRYYGNLALNSVGCLLLSDWNSCNVVLLDEHLQFDRILIHYKQLKNERPSRLYYNKNNNRLAVGVQYGHVRIFDCNKIM